MYRVVVTLHREIMLVIRGRPENKIEPRELDTAEALVEHDRLMDRAARLGIEMRGQGRK